MNKQDSENQAILKRQTTFLKTIDQKLEGLRRENERLMRLASNPRVVFSRSSLAGLYRIVNSLLSAGPMYGLLSIEQWAKQTRDWLVVLGKRGAGLKEEELNLLQDAINDLAKLRDEALADISSKLQDVEPTFITDEAVDNNLGTDINIEPALEENRTEKLDVLIEVEENGLEITTSENKDNQLPFQDEPKAQSIKEANQKNAASLSKSRKVKHKINKDTHFRDRTSTIPLAIDDLAIINAASKAPSPLHTEKKPTFWKVLALFSTMGFVVVTGLYLLRPPCQSTPCSTTPFEPQPCTSVVPTSVIQPSSSSEENTKNIEEDKKTVSGVENTDAVAKENSDINGDNKSISKPLTGTSASVPSRSKPGKTQNPEGGTLIIKAPAEGGDVSVLINGVPKGKAPLKLSLSSGLHEVTFISGGKRAIRMVPIKKEQTRTMEAISP